MKEPVIQKYCIGCGLCQSALGLQMNTDSKGYLTLPDHLTQEQLEFIDQVCPVSNQSLDKIDWEQIWGKYNCAYLGHSNVASTRKKASSGGVLSQIACHLLNHNIVDGVIQVKVSSTSQIETQLTISTTEKDVLEACGSRYTISSPLTDLLQKVDLNKKYAVIGKPCDVTALRNFIDLHVEYKECIVYLLSFFCAGLPSRKANEKLLERLKTSEKECVALSYRGNGWPGDATAVKKDGTAESLDYAAAWGGILGRDVHPFCRFCMDGIGERADISCGDAWFLKNDGTPDFQDHEGRNIVFGRTIKGEQLLKAMQDEQELVLEPFEDFHYLRQIQKYQYDRKTTESTRIRAFKLMNKKCPYRYSRVPGKFSKYADSRTKRKIFLGTIKRILTGKIH